MRFASLGVATDERSSGSDVGIVGGGTSVILCFDSPRGYANEGGSTIANREGADVMRCNGLAWRF